LTLVADRFLNISIDYLGHILYDDKILKSVRRQKVVCEMFPEASASRCFQTLANTVRKSGSGEQPSLNSNFLWKHIV
jgi:flagellar biosynthesis protein FlhG